ncbi:MAG TPA: hypothetical protein VF744_12905 [Beijerinckiaceae bacterium]
MALSFSKTKKAVLSGVAALTLGGAMLASTAPAEAQWRGGWHRGGGWHGAAWRGGWGYRPAYWGGWGYRRHHWGGGAVAAGLVGGLALGALAARPYYYGYGYPYGAYYAPVAYGGDCWVERRVRINRWGERVVRRIQVCG